MCALVFILCFATIAPGAEKQKWTELRNQIDRTLHLAEVLPKTQEKGYGGFSPAPGVTADRVAYSTDYALRVPAIAYHAAGATIAKHPAIVVVNAGRGDKSSWYAYWAGILYARAGAVVLTYDPIGQYERNSERQSGVDCVPATELAQRMDGLMVTDVLQAVSYLLTRKDVDPKRIALVSYSAASFVAALACAADSRVHACVVSDADLKQIPGHDENWFESLRKQTMGALATSKNLLQTDPASGTSPRAEFLTRKTALWLEQELQFPNWTKKDIEAMPETRVMDWAMKTGLTSPRGIRDENGEGGTMALGTDIPAVPRADLHAIPEAVWDAERDNFLYETWMDRAKSAIRSGAP